MKINIKNARRLIQILEDENNPVDFNMASWFVHNEETYDDSTEIRRIVREHPCGTVACLAGHAALEAWETGEVSGSLSVQETATEWLGLEYWVARALFHGHWSGKSAEKHLNDITKEEAISELTRLIQIT